MHKEKLGKGNQYGEIIVRTPYQKLVYHVLASRGNGSSVNLDLFGETVPRIHAQGVSDFCMRENRLSDMGSRST